MVFINELEQGKTVDSVYMVKEMEVKQTKTGKPYLSMKVADKTGTVDCRVWDVVSEDIDFQKNDYVEILAGVTSFNDVVQLNANKIRKADPESYDLEDYIPVSPKDPVKMWNRVVELIDSIENKYLKKLLEDMLINDKEIRDAFQIRSAARGVHHAFSRGLIHHSVSVANNCEYIANAYDVVNRDLIITAALLHDIGKTRELTPFPENDYSTEGNFLGHIIIGIEMIGEKIRNIPDFPEDLAMELKHCIAAHHGSLEFGSPKTPALAEAMALSFADDMDAKLEVITELLGASDKDPTEWLGFNRWINSNLRKTII